MRYKIKQASPLRAFATYLTVMFLGLGIIFFLASNQILPEGKSLVAFLCFTPFVALAFYLPHYTATAETEILIDNTRIKRKWLRPFMLQNKQDEEFKWSDILDYAHQTGSRFEQFKLRLKDGRKLKLYHNNLHEDKDDFRAFLSGFVQRVERINKANQDKQNDIKLGKTVYDQTWGLLIAAVAVIVIVGLPIMLFVLPENGSPTLRDYAVLFVVYLPAIYLISQVYTHRKRRKKYLESI